MTLIDYDENNLGKVGNLRNVNSSTFLADNFIVHGEIA